MSEIDEIAMIRSWCKTLPDSSWMVAAGVNVSLDNLEKELASLRARLEEAERERDTLKLEIIASAKSTTTYVNAREGEAASLALSIARLVRDRDAARDALRRLLKVVSDAGTWCDSDLVDRDCAWHITSEQSNELDLATEAAEAALAPQAGEQEAQRE